MSAALAAALLRPFPNVYAINIYTVSLKYKFNVLCERTDNTHTHTNKRTHVGTHARTDARTHARTHARAHVRTHARRTRTHTHT